MEDRRAWNPRHRPASYPRHRWKRLGDRASIRVDVNQAWDDATGAKGCRELAAMGVDLIEQPVSAHDNAALVRYSQQIETAIRVDEAVANRLRCGYQLAQQGFTGAYALKIAKAGGPNSVCWRWPGIAQAAGIGLYGGTMLEGTVGTVASLQRLVDAAAAVGYRGCSARCC
ncbi:hypothetical protein MJ588_15540 [Klebsiella pneumoniae]|nr:hypothetical protein MJ588_15540 [Klebsiella pneumoniae]